MGHMSRWGADLAGLQCRILLPYRPLYPTLFYTMPPRSILSRCSTRHPSNRESISRRFATPFIPCAPPTKPLTPYHIVLSRPAPFHPLPSPPIIPFTSLSLTVAFYLFPSLPIPSHLATTVSLPFNTFPYPLQTFSYPFHALSIPFPYRPVLSHLFASLLTPSRPIPFYSFPLPPSPSSLPIHSSPSLTPSLSLSSPFRSHYFDVDYPLRSTTITRTRRRRISQQIADWGSSGPIFAERPRTKYPFLEPLPDRKPGFRGYPAHGYAN